MKGRVLEFAQARRMSRLRELSPKATGDRVLAFALQEAQAQTDGPAAGVRELHVVCPHCMKQWIARFQAGTRNLECPRCGVFSGIPGKTPTILVDIGKEGRKED